MGFNTDFVVEKLAETNFEILEIDNDPDTGNIDLKIKHDIHPDIEVLIKLITKEDSGDDTMEMEFIGPDEYTDEEAKQVLQDIMDFLVGAIEKALEEVPTPVDTDENSDEGETSDGDN
jgi:hypothetical protein